MSMVVKNNMSAVHTLNTLNQNSSALQKSLAKVSSGMKINSAQDDASAYAISESMRVRIRSLDQANQNTQNASSMVKVAEGAVSSTLEIVKTMKEKAINSANDTNTDQDRLTIQKEIDQFIDQVDDNSLVSFNGKILLDGSSMPLNSHEYTDEQNIVRGLNSAWISDALDLIKDSYGIDFQSGPNNTAAARTLEVNFYTDDTSTTVASCGSNYGLSKVVLNINLGQVKDLDPQSQNGEYNGSGTQYLDRVIAHELTHGVMINRFEHFSQLKSWIIEGGTAEFVHGADDTRGDLTRFISAAGSRDANGNISITSSGMDSVFAASGTGSAAIDAYGGGFVAMHYFAANANVDTNQAMKDFMAAMDRGATVDEAFNTASGGKFTSEADFEKQMKESIYTFVTEGGHTAAEFLKGIGIDQSDYRSDGLQVDTGSVTGSESGGKVAKFAKSVVHEVGKTVNWRLPSSTSTMIGGLEVKWPSGLNTSNGGGGSTVFHVGASANQAINIGFNDMSARGIGLYDENDEKLDVTTKGKANAAIGTLDKIVNLVVDQQTNIGAMLQRLEYTSSNLTVGSENTQAAESTIRDADMAKEMTNYTKNNVLMQAAQSMLAQANQSSSAVLSLLQ